MTDQADLTPKTTTENGITLESLQSKYDEGESIDSEVFAEMRSNILLVAGDHYANRLRKAAREGLRGDRGVSSEQRLRLTKNHIYKIMRTYENSIVSYAPGVSAEPYDAKSIQDVKDAELHNLVMKHAKIKHRIREKVREWASDFTTIGEVCTKVFFDPNKGSLIGYEQDEDADGNPLYLTLDEEETLEPTGEFGEPNEPKPGKAIFSGDFVVERIYGFNLLRDPEAESMQESSYLTIRKMRKKKAMLEAYKGQPEKQAAFKESHKETYLIFDAQRSQYGRSKEQILVCETYYKPSIEYPNGYYVFWTQDGIFEEGELPFGVFPLAYASFDQFQTTPRGRSHIKVLRPFQTEINRAASKLAEHQITLGDDKVIHQVGTTLTQSSLLPGIRSFAVSGPPPTVIAGRDGSQFAEYAAGQILEMYKASLVEEELQEKPSQLDPYTLLFIAASKKKKFSLYTERFEQFMIDFWNIYLGLARHYMSDEELLDAVGKDQIALLEEFREEKKWGYNICLEPQVEDEESKIGRQIKISQTLQYVGSQLSRQDIGKLLKSMPFANGDKAFDELTRDSDIADNTILALDRGKYPPIKANLPHQAILESLVARQLKPDYDTLPDQVKMLYDRRIQDHQQVLAQQLAEMKAREQDYIPTTGGLIACDLYVPDPNNPKRTTRLRIPSDALKKLAQDLEIQTGQMGPLNDLPAGTKLNILDEAARMGHLRGVEQQQQLPPGNPQGLPLPQNLNPGGTPMPMGQPQI